MTIRKQFFLRGALAALPVWFCACQLFQSQTNSTNGGSGLSVHLQVRPAALARLAATAPALTDSAVVTVSAPDFSPRVFGFGGAGFDFVLNDLTPGTGRDFKVELLRQGRVLYTGEIDTTLYADRQNLLLLHCLPRFSRVAASAHVPVDFPWDVVAGKLILSGGGDTLTADMTRSGEFLLFDVEEVPGDQTYSASLQLWDSAQAVVATAQDTVAVLMGQSVNLDLTLLTTEAQLQMGLDFAAPQQTSLHLAFPAGRRAPSAFGDVIFSELYPAPSSADSGSDGEWLEIFNRTSDTLDLGGCGISRDGGGTSTKQVLFPNGTALPPGRAWVAGHADAPSPSLVLTSFSLPNSLSRVQLFCADSLLLDTVTYSLAAADSFAVAAGNGEVTELRPSQIAQRARPSAWCLVPSHPDSAGQGNPTPGSLDDGCPE